MGYAQNADPMLTQCCSPERLYNAQSSSLQSCPQLVDEYIDGLHIVRVQLLLRLEIGWDVGKGSIEARLEVAHGRRERGDCPLPDHLIRVLRRKAHENGNRTDDEEL